MNGERKDFLSATPPASAGVLDTGIRAEQHQTPAGEAAFIDEKELLARLPVSRGTLSNWKAKGLIPFIKIGRRCLYDWVSVQGALLRRQRGGSLEPH
jgi:hypothetical protein